MASGTAIAAAFAIVAGLGIGLVVAYHLTSTGAPPMSMDLERSSRDAAAAANETVHVPDWREVRRNAALEDHLDTAVDSGASRETLRLRVASMVEDVVRLTGETDGQAFVEWKSVVVRITWREG